MYANTITTEGLRHNNRAIVLSALRKHGASSHTTIAEKTGLASGTVSVITGEFFDEGVLEKLEQAPVSARGRPRTLFVPRSDFAHIVLVRISAEKIEYSMIDYSGTLIDRQTLPRKDQETSIDLFKISFRAELETFIARSQKSKKDIKVVSITTRGEVNESTQTLVWSPFFGDQKVNFGTVLKPDWPGQVSLTNELCFVAHNVMMQQIQKDEVGIGSRSAVLSLSDSISLGVAKIGLHGDIELSSPSFGHMAHSEGGPLCRCGARGCLESHAGFYGILRKAYDAPLDTIQSKFVPQDQMTELAKSARNGDRQTELAFRQAGSAIGLCLARMFNVLGGMPVTVVGAGLEFYDLLKDSLEEQLNESFTVRMGKSPLMSFSESQSEMAFDSNSFESLRKFDREIVATKVFLQGTKK